MFTDEVDVESEVKRATKENWIVNLSNRVHSSAIYSDKKDWKRNTSTAGGRGSREESWGISITFNSLLYPWSYVEIKHEGVLMYTLTHTLQNQAPHASIYTLNITQSELGESSIKF